MKPDVYQEIPDYDQETQYVVQLEPIELEDCIYYAVEVRDLDLDDNEPDPYEFLI